MHHKILEELTEEDFLDMDEYFRAQEEAAFEAYIHEQEEFEKLAEFMDELNPPETEVRGLDE